MFDLFQRAPTLGGECYLGNCVYCPGLNGFGFKGHPPLGVNATGLCIGCGSDLDEFQRAPTLGGECYLMQSALQERRRYGFNGHPPLGVNATGRHRPRRADRAGGVVSMGTHPWG